VPSPVWQAATPGQPGMAGHVNQLLVTHPAVYVWAGALQAAQQTAGPGGAASNGTYLAQAFTTGSGQVTTGAVVVTAGFTGSPAPWGFSLQAGSGSFPSGTPLASAWLPPEFASASPGPVTLLLPASGLAASTQYWIVAAPQGTSSAYFTWAKSNQSSGAATSADGVTWAAQGYGLMFQVRDGAPAGLLTGITEDGGARSTVFLYAGGMVGAVLEFTAGQTAAGYAASARAASYSGPLLTGVA
jgi:hypothetical protein